MTTSKIGRPKLLAISAFANFAPLVFLVTEAIAALGWNAGAYDYSYNYISDLGTTVCGSFLDGREMCSPLHAVMNFGYVTMAVAVAITVALLASALPRGRRITARILAVLVPIGMIQVASFPGGAESVPDGTIRFHVLGAVLAILSGNLLAILFGSNRKQLSWPTWYGTTSVVLGFAGLIGLVLVIVAGSYEHSAIFERVSVYAIFAWLFITSMLAFRTARRRSILRAGRGA